MLQMDFTFLNVEIISGFTSTFVDICSVTSNPFRFPSRSKNPPLDILKFLFTKFRNQYIKDAFIRFDENGALARFSGLMKTCQNMNIIVQTTGGDTYSVNGKIEIPNKTLSNITINLLLKLSHKKELWWFYYQYTIWFSCRTENRLCGDIPYLLWNGTGPTYGVWEYTSSMDVLQVRSLMIDHIGVISWDMQILN